MNSGVLGVAAMFLYGLAAARIAALLGRSAAPAARLQGIGLAFAALAVHAVLLYQGIVTGSGLNLSIANAASLVAGLVSLVVVAAALTRPADGLAVLILPIAALAIGAEMLFPGQRILPRDAPRGLEVHVALAIVAYSVLAVAAIQALMVAFAEHRLRQRRPTLVMQLLPPLQTMEDLLFQLIGVGLFLLSLGLVSGFMFVHDLFAQHLVHKTVLSLLAWITFAVLLWGRRRFGWRGRTAVRYTLAGFAFLALAFFGSNFVLEVVLKRV
ncbi:MAG: inner membrane protein YpjD [Gammaproteobacteria bacterium]